MSEMRIFSLLTLHLSEVEYNLKVKKTAASSQIRGLTSTTILNTSTDFRARFGIMILKLASCLILLVALVARPCKAGSSGDVASQGETTGSEEFAPETFPIHELQSCSSHDIESFLDKINPDSIHGHQVNCQDPAQAVHSSVHGTAANHERTSDEVESTHNHGEAVLFDRYQTIRLGAMRRLRIMKAARRLAEKRRLDGTALSAHDRRLHLKCLNARRQRELKWQKKFGVDVSCIALNWDIFKSKRLMNHSYVAV